MQLVYAVCAIIVFVITIGIVGHILAKHLDKKYGTEHKKPPQSW